MTIGREDKFGVAEWLERAQPTASSIAALTQRATVIVEALGEEKVYGMGSGFIIRIPPPAHGYLPDYLVVTARHNVDGAAVRNARTLIKISHLRVNAWQQINVEVPINDWYYFSRHDIALARLPLWLMVQAPSLAALPLGMLYNRAPWLGPTDVQLYGASDVGENILILARRGSLPTTEMPRVRLENFANSLPVNIVEGITTPGMSGGPVVVSNGPKLEANVLLGLIYGYATPILRNVAQFDAIDEQGVRDVLRQHSVELHARRQQLVYVVPTERILDAADEFLTALYPDRTTRLGSLA